MKMPRKKKSVNQLSTTKQDNTDSTINSENEDPILTLSENMCSESRLSLQIADVEEKFQDNIKRLFSMKENALSKMDMIFNSMVLKIPQNILETPINMASKEFREFILNIHCETSNSNAKANESNSSSLERIVRRRSKSARSIQYSDNTDKLLEIKNLQRKRSSSLDLFKTPKISKVCLSDFSTAKKYSVSKPKRIEDSGITVKRIMKPHEEAISTKGSPLFVNQNFVNAPTVNIPLPGGVVMNIEPKKPRGHFTVPELDEKTKSQLKILCQQLNKMF